MSGGDVPRTARPSDPPNTVRIAVDLPGPQGERLYDYLPPERGAVEIGDAVVVPFGGRRAIGIVTSSVGALPPPSGVTLKRAEAKLSGDPLIGSLGMRLAESIATHWLAPLALTVRSPLPPGLLDKVEVAIRSVGAPSEAEERVGISQTWVSVERLAGARGSGRSALLALIRSGERDGRLERSWRLCAVHGRLIEEAYASRTSAADLPEARTRLGLRQRELLAMLRTASRPMYLVGTGVSDCLDDDEARDLGAVWSKLDRLAEEHGLEQPSNFIAVGDEGDAANVPAERLLAVFARLQEQVQRPGTKFPAKKKTLLVLQKITATLSELLHRGGGGRFELDI